MYPLSRNRVVCVSDSTTVFYHGIPLPTLRTGKPCLVPGSGYPRGKASRNRCAVPALIYAFNRRWFKSDSRCSGRTQQKNNFEVFAYLARGARILPCFNGIMVIPLDTICGQSRNYALGSLSRMERRHGGRNELRLRAESHTGEFDL
jgi:hypothetical protein